MDLSISLFKKEKLIFWIVYERRISNYIMNSELIQFVKFNCSINSKTEKGKFIECC